MDFTKTRHGEQLVNELLKSETTVPLTTLIEHLGVSRRSVFYTITKVNEELASCHLDEIENIRGVGYRLSAATKQAVLEEQPDKQTAANYQELFAGQFHFSSLEPTDRRLLIFFCLISRPATSLTSLMILFAVSKNTVIKDLSHLTQQLPVGLTIKNSSKGKYVHGDEALKRRWVFENFPQLTKLTAAQITFNTSAHFRDQLKLLERITGNSFTNDSLNLLTTFAHWLIERQQHHRLPARQLTADDYSLTFTWADSFLNDLHINSAAEAMFLAEIVNTQAFQHVGADNPMIPLLRPIASQMIRRFNEIAAVELPTSDHTLNKKLTVHLVSTYYRVKYHINYRNPLVNQIKHSYRETFELVKQAVRPFNQFTGETLSDDEIALIAVYFSGALRNTDLPAKEKPSVLVICSSGIGTSELLIAQLRGRYPGVHFVGPYNTFQFENIHYQTIKLVLSTIDLPQMPDQVPVMTVPVIPGEADWQQIGTRLQDAHLIEAQHQPVQLPTLMDIIATHTRIVDPQGLENDLKAYLSNQTQQQPRITAGSTTTTDFVSQPVHWQEALRFSMNKLVAAHVIDDQYVSKIIQLTKTHGDYMAIGKGVFLAHATPEAGVNELGFSYTFFAHPFCVDHSDKQINFVVGLAPVDQRQHLAILSRLLRCVQNDQWMGKLQQVQQASELTDLLRKGKLLEES
ncbi:BglG family transcription antiterminator [uncultured Limosilactobacillus sp.]|uniref:BglG family transcription antiterminator n=1 Tax=uncultured Limosilactobacillus sp. TaxID=2837629 RepID=UPI0025EA497B|nr:BglG family transcription antiterminator [uncultured Limosilactobacillus sp.]